MKAETWALGSQLCAEDRKYVIAAYVNRYTLEHVPAWAKKPRPDGKPYPPQFADDNDWLQHTSFAVTKSGRLDRRVKHCLSHAQPIRKPAMSDETIRRTIAGLVVDLYDAPGAVRSWVEGTGPKPPPSVNDDGITAAKRSDLFRKAVTWCLMGHADWAAFDAADGLRCMANHYPGRGALARQRLAVLALLRAML